MNVASQNSGWPRFETVQVAISASHHCHQTSVQGWQFAKCTCVGHQLTKFRSAFNLSLADLAVFFPLLMGTCKLFCLSIYLESAIGSMDIHQYSVNCHHIIIISTPTTTVTAKSHKSSHSWGLLSERANGDRWSPKIQAKNAARQRAVGPGQGEALRNWRRAISQWRSWIFGMIVIDYVYCAYRPSSFWPRGLLSATVELSEIR